MHVCVLCAWVCVVRVCDVTFSITVIFVSKCSKLDLCSELSILWLLKHISPFLNAAMVMCLLCAILFITTNLKRFGLLQKLLQPGFEPKPLYHEATLLTTSPMLEPV